MTEDNDLGDFIHFGEYHIPYEEMGYSEEEHQQLENDADFKDILEKVQKRTVKKI